MGCTLQFLIGLLLALAMLLGIGFPFIEAPVPAQISLPCTVITERADVPVRVGPGENRAVRLFLPAGEPIPVSGRASVDDTDWWQLDLEGVEQAWVSQADVEAAGECANVPAVEAPPVVAPAQAAPEPGGWGLCGSCDSCLGPAAECVTNPDGQCVWDATRCGGASGSGEAGSQEPPPPQGTEEVAPPPPPVSTPELTG
jgi:hypothetical protein